MTAHEAKINCTSQGSPEQRSHQKAIGFPRCTISWPPRQQCCWACEGCTWPERLSPSKKTMIHPGLQEWIRAIDWHFFRGSVMLAGFVSPLLCLFKRIMISPASLLRPIRPTYSRVSFRKASLWWCASMWPGNLQKNHDQGCENQVGYGWNTCVKCKTHM